MIYDPALDLLLPANPAIMSSKSQLTYAARASSHPNPLARRLFEVAEAKKSNVTVSADVTTTKELLDLADRTAIIIPLQPPTYQLTIHLLYRPGPLHRRDQNPHRHPLRL